jgi:hypothetical protein
VCGSQVIGDKAQEVAIIEEAALGQGRQPSRDGMRSGQDAPALQT